MKRKVIERATLFALAVVVSLGASLWAFDDSKAFASGPVTLSAGQVGCALDYSKSRPSYGAVKSSGCGVLRYADVQGVSSKNITPSELARLHAQGTPVGLVFERGAARAADGYGAGRFDAARLNRGLAQLGLPVSTVAYVAVDFDAIASQVSSYLAGWNSVRPAGVTGVYGSVRIVNYARSAGIAGYGWATYAWRYGQAWPAPAVAQVRQVRNGVSYGGGTVDIDELMSTDWGQIGAVRTGRAYTPPVVVAKPPAVKRTVVKKVVKRKYSGSVHVVRRGETLSGIARSHGTTTRRLAAINRIKNPNFIKTGQKVRTK